MIRPEPADVLKYVYVNKIGLEQTDDARKFYLNSVDSNRIVLGRGGRALNLNPPRTTVRSTTLCTPMPK